MVNGTTTPPLTTTTAVPGVEPQFDFYEFMKGLRRHTEPHAMSFGYNDIQLAW